jgi:hypothetical protein
MSISILCLLAFGMLLPLLAAYVISCCTGGEGGGQFETAVIILTACLVLHNRTGSILSFGLYMWMISMGWAAWSKIDGFYRLSYKIPISRLIDVQIIYTHVLGPTLIFFETHKTRFCMKDLLKVCAQYVRGIIAVTLQYSTEFALIL